MSTNYLTSLTSSWEFNETSGNFLDQTTAANDLTVVGATQGATGLFNFCGSYDGINDYATRTDASLSSGMKPTTGAFSYEVWIKSTSVAGTNDIFNRANVTNDKGYRLLVLGSDAGKAQVVVSDGGAGAHNKFVRGTSNCLSGSAFQLVCTVDRVGQLLNLYVNGVAEGAPADISLVGSVDATGYDLLFGVYTGLSNYYPGLIDRVRFWNGRTLSGTEVLNLYNGGFGIPYAMLGGNGSSSRLRRRTHS